jgi:hypothetical protein
MIIGRNTKKILEIKAMTEVSNKEKGIIKQKEEYLPTEKIEGDPAWVSVSAGGTINLGNYSSGKVNISITYPCEPSQVDQVFDKLKGWIDKRVGEEISELRESASKPKDMEI